MSTYTISSGTYGGLNHTFSGNVILTGNITFTTDTTIYAPNGSIDCSGANITVVAGTSVSGTPRRTLTLSTGGSFPITINTINATGSDIFLYAAGVIDQITQVPAATVASITAETLWLYAVAWTQGSKGLWFNANQVVLVNSQSATIFSGTTNINGINYQNWDVVVAGAVRNFGNVANPNLNPTRILVAGAAGVQTKLTALINTNSPFNVLDPITFSKLQTELGGTNPIGLSEYRSYSGWPYSGSVGFPNGTATNIPSAGTIGIKNFYGFRKIFYYDVSANVNDLTLNSTAGTVLKNAGWNGSSHVYVRIKSGVTVGATSATDGAVRVSGSFPAGLTIEVEASAFINGRGGAGGTGGGTTSGSGNIAAVPGSPGGPAIRVFSYTGPRVLINNYGTIRGGGGGGGGGGSAIGTIPFEEGFADQSSGGGGGGAGSGGGAAGSGGTANWGFDRASGSAGTAGTSNTAGSGGAGGNLFSAVGGTGGAGGAYGTAGSAGANGSGSSSFAGAAGGAAGAYLSGITFADIIIYNSGTLLGNFN